MSIIAALIIGAIAGWLAGLIVRGAGFGLIGNIVVGIIGALVAGFILPRLGVVLAGGVAGQVIDATIGAVIVLVILVYKTRMTILMGIATAAQAVVSCSLPERSR